MNNLVDSDYPKKIEKKQQPEEVALFKVPTEIIDLPSRGLVYPAGSPLADGKLEVKYMTAKEEDILTTESFIKDNSVIDRFLQSIIVTEGVELRDLLPGDVNALMLAARIFGYGAEYEGKVTNPSGKKQTIVVDLSALEMDKLEDKYVSEEHSNSFSFELPASKVWVKFKMLTYGEVENLQKSLDKELSKKKSSPILKNVPDTASSSYLKAQIIAVGEETSKKSIHSFVDNALLAVDARALRQYITAISPSVDLSVEGADKETGEPFRSPIDFGPQFFWLTSKHKPELYIQLINLSYHSNGAFSFPEAYNLPIIVRKMAIEEIASYIKKSAPKKEVRRHVPTAPLPR